MKSKPYTKFIHEGQYVAEVEIELIEADDSWSPTISLADAERLDRVRQMLRNADIQQVSRIARVYKLLPVSA